MRWILPAEQAALARSEPDQFESLARGWPGSLAFVQWAYAVFFFIWEHREATVMVESHADNNCWT